MTKNILITGGAGFIGSNLVDCLLAEGGWKVTVIDDFNDFYEPSIKREMYAHTCATLATNFTR
jgi:UDP-glucuronate 4-epimerase